MTARPVQRRHWRSYGTDPLPTGAEALHSAQGWKAELLTGREGASSRPVRRIVLIEG